ncbi:MAG: Crp/Fnr family transcriptional regulator, partial [Bacteroidetes bacterium]
MVSTTATPTDTLSQFALFDVLTYEEKLQLQDMLEYRVRPKYSFIYLADEPSDTVFFLLKGTVKIGTHSQDGREIIKALVHPSTMFGELGLIGERTRQEFAQALKEEVHLYALKVRDFKRLMRQNFNLCDRVMGAFGERLMRAENKLESLISKDARTRIIDFIKESIAKRGKKIGYEMLLTH